MCGSFSWRSFLAKCVVFCIFATTSTNRIKENEPATEHFARRHRALSVGLMLYERQRPVALRRAARTEGTKREGAIGADQAG